MNKKTFSISEAISFGWNTFKSNWKFWIISFFIFSVASGSAVSGINTSKNFNIPTNSTDEGVYESPYPVDYSDEVGSNVLRDVPQNVLGATSFSLNKENPTPQDYQMPLKNNSTNFSKWLWVLAPIGIVVLIAFLIVALISTLISVVFRMGYLNLTLDAARNKEVYYKTILNQVSLKKAYRFLIANFLVALNVVIGLILFIIPGILYALKYYYVSYLVVDKDMKPIEAMKESSKLTKGVRFKLLGMSFVFGLISLLGVIVFGVGLIPASIVVSLANAYVFNKLLEQSESVVPHKSVVQPTPTIDVPVPSSNEVPSVDSGNLLAENPISNDDISVKTEN